MTDFDKEIRELEARINSLKSAKAEAEEKAKRVAEENARRTAEAKKAKDKMMYNAATEIGEGIHLMKKGFSKIMDKEDFEFISKLLLNEKIIPICFDLVEVCKEPLFGPMIESMFGTVYDDNKSNDAVRVDKPRITITPKNISEEDVDVIIQNFINSLGD